MKSDLKQLDIGLRGTMKNFKQTFTKEFLKKHGYDTYEKIIPFSGIRYVLCQTVQTKYGEMVIRDEDVVTYVGNRIWSVDRNKSDGKNNENAAN